MNRRHPLRSALFGLLALLALVGACGPAPSGLSRAGAPERLVPLAPNLTEITFALGLGPRVVGVDDYVNHPPEALTLPRLGGLFNPNFEAIVGLRPDLVLVLPSEADVAERLARVGIPTETVEVESVADVSRAFRQVATRCGIPAVGEVAAARLDAALTPQPVAVGLRVLLVVGREPGPVRRFYAAGPGTFLDDLLQRLGAENALAGSRIKYPEVSLEEVLAGHPDVILELSAEITDLAGREKSILADWAATPGLPPETRVAALVGGYTLVPGPRLPLLYTRLAEVLTR